jgi:hypothetical protein
MNTSRTLPAIVVFLLVMLSSCYERAFFQSPLQGNSAVYRTVPVASDSVKSATYVSGALSIGGMNQRWRDGVYKLQMGLHRGHVVNNVRLNYGASLALGSYRVKPYFDYRANYTDSGRGARGYFFGAYGVYGGISVASKLGRRGEWRFIGLDASLFNEFGDYASFRKNLPDSAASQIDRKRYFGSLGLNTELIFKFKSQHKFGIKIAAGSFLRRLQYNNAPGSSITYYYDTYDDLLYFSNTYHFTVERATTWFQFNLATHAAHFQLGLNYRL